MSCWAPVSDSVAVGWGKKNCVSNRLPGAGPPVRAPQDHSLETLVGFHSGRLTSPGCFQTLVPGFQPRGADLIDLKWDWSIDVFRTLQVS